MGHGMGINIGDVLFQLAMFLLILGLPICVIIVTITIFVFNKRLNRIEEKIDKVLSEKENRKM